MRSGSIITALGGWSALCPSAIWYFDHRMSGCFFVLDALRSIKRMLLLIRHLPTGTALVTSNIYSGIFIIQGQGSLQPLATHDYSGYCNYLTGLITLVGGHFVVKSDK